jgi:hypothetical protein
MPSFLQGNRINTDVLCDVRTRYLKLATKYSIITPHFHTPVVVTS